MAAFGHYTKCEPEVQRQIFFKKDQFTCLAPHPIGIFYCSSNLMKVGLYLHLPIQNSINNVRREIRMINIDTVFS